MLTNTLPLVLSSIRAATIQTGTTYRFRIGSVVRTPTLVGYRRGKILEHIERTVGNGSYWLVDEAGNRYRANEVVFLKEGPNMARGRKADATKAEAAKKKEESSRLMEALRFCAPGFKDGGEPFSTHAMIHAGYCTTYDGVLTFGHPVQEQFSALPHFGQLLAAVRSAGDSGMSIAQLDMGRLSIKAKKFRVVVPCLQDPALVHRHMPDQPVSMLDSRMRDGFEIMKQVATKNAEHVLTASVLVDNGTMTATDRKLLVQFWHGLGFPKLTVPANFVEAVLKVPKDLVSFGYTDSSLTFWFADHSYIRTQLYSEEWPDIDGVWPMSWDGMQQLPDEFFEALAQIRPFVPKETRHILCYEHKMQTHDEDNTGAVIDCPGLLESPYGIDVDRILGLRGKVTHMDYANREVACFIGPNLRGVCTQMVFDRDAVEAAAGYHAEPAPFAAPSAAPPMPQTTAAPVAEQAPPAEGYVTHISHDPTQVSYSYPAASADSYAEADGVRYNEFTGPPSNEGFHPPESEGPAVYYDEEPQPMPEPEPQPANLPSGFTLPQK